MRNETTICDYFQDQNHQTWKLQQKPARGVESGGAWSCLSLVAPLSRRPPQPSCAHELQNISKAKMSVLQLHHKIKEPRRKLTAVQKDFK